MKNNLSLHPEVKKALENNQPVVALESTVISHGLPYPQNIELARDLENIVRDNGATPATIAVMDGKLCVGLDETALMRLADGKTDVRKLSRRDLGSALAKNEIGATTVAATMLIASLAGIKVFATGGIGGVHRGSAGDVSADLIELSQTPVAVVCAGAKSILDLPRTLEWLETFGVPVVGFGTQEFPAFYSRSSGLQLVDSVQSAEEAAALLRCHWGLGLQNGALITVPVPSSEEIPPQDINGIIEQAVQEAEEQHVIGKDITPFLLKRLVEMTDGRSLRTNLALLKNNARVGAAIAAALVS